MVPRMSIFILSAVALFTVATTDTRAQSVLTHHVREVIHTAQAQSTGHMASDQVFRRPNSQPAAEPEAEATAGAHVSA